MIKLIIQESDNHYYIINGWKKNYKVNTADFSETFDIYKKAYNYFNELKENCKYVDLYEVIGTKKKLIKKFPEDDK